MTAQRYRGRRFIDLAYGVPVASYFEAYIEATWTPYRHFKLDEASGSFVDAGSAATNATVTGNPVYSQAGVGLDVTDTGVSFDGVSDYANLNAPLIGTADTTGAVFLVASAGAVQANNYPRFWNGDSTATPATFDRLAFGLWFNLGYPFFQIARKGISGNRTRAWTATGDLRDDVARFYALVQRADGNGPRLFIDGVEQTTFTDTTTGTVPALDSWGAAMVDPSSQRWILAGDARTTGTAEIVAKIYHVSSVSNVNVSDAEIAAMAALIP